MRFDRTNQGHYGSTSWEAMQGPEFVMTEDLTTITTRQSRFDKDSLFTINQQKSKKTGEVKWTVRRAIDLDGEGNIYLDGRFMVSKANCP